MHVAHRLLSEGYTVTGLDNCNPYYDPRLKTARIAELAAFPNFAFKQLHIADRKTMSDLFATERFSCVVHLAAQAGVRHSLNEPHAYVDANLVGFLNVLEGCRHSQCRHLLYASPSSVYGANRHMPFRTSDNVDHPLNLYGATKKANELMAHAYAHEVEQVVRLIEQILGKSAIRELLPMQPGNVLETYADVSALCEAVGSSPRSWLGRPQAGVALLQQLSQQNGFAQEMISALEERAIWSRYGL